MILRPILATFLALAPFGVFAANSTPTPPPDKPIISATTANIGQHVVTSSAGRSNLLLGVKVDLRFMKPPLSDYQIQCFFVAKENSTQKLYVYQTLVETSREPAYSKTFQAGPLFPSAQQWLQIPDSSYIPSLGLSYGPAQGNSKVYGWLVRVVSQGQTVGAESNQVPLNAAVKKYPEAFDDDVKKAAP